MLQIINYLVIIFLCFILYTPCTYVLATENSVLFFDDFDNGNMDGWTVIEGTWSVNQSTLMEYHTGNNKHGRIEAGNDNWDNFRLELDVKNEIGIDEGIGFRKNSSSSISYELTLRHGNSVQYNTPQAILYKVVWEGNQQKETIPIISVRPPNLTNLNYYHIKIEAINDHISVWIDDTRIIDIFDHGTEIIKGHISLATWTGSLSSVKVRFDNIKITSLSNTPQPFLDLPWDYQGKNMDFNEAALSINSFFDHEYPLLSAGTSVAEAPESKDWVITFQGKRGVNMENLWYSAHDGYDYGRSAKVLLRDPVRAAASGRATYHYNSLTGNTIFIDHYNDYQTRYYHLSPEYLVTKSAYPGVDVNAGDRIGLVDSTGTSSTGPHIHFMVIHDKNGDKNFDDNLIDGVIDPFGWQDPNASTPDPWENYKFKYNNLNKTGDKSYYLWKHSLMQKSVLLSAAAANHTIGRYTFDFPENSTTQELTLNVKSSPIVKAVISTKPLASLGSAIEATTYGPAGDVITEFSKRFNLTADISIFDLSRYLPSSISFYSSSDGLSWTKESSALSIDKKTITARPNHMTTFAVLGERVDTNPPITDVEISGNLGQGNWFSSDVQVNFNPKDSGLGAAYLRYKTDTNEWQTFEATSSPLLMIRDEGKHEIKYYSIDKDDNTENTQTMEINIDKTLPVVTLATSKSILWPANGKFVEIRVSGNSQDDNLSETLFQIIDEYGLIQPVITGFGQTIKLEAKRNGGDLDGRKYIVKAIAKDRASNTTVTSAEIIVPHDLRLWEENRSSSAYPGSLFLPLLQAL